MPENELKQKIIKLVMRSKDFRKLELLYRIAKKILD